VELHLQAGADVLVYSAAGVVVEVSCRLSSDVVALSNEKLRAKQNPTRAWHVAAHMVK
jgi:hypothetical protein